MDISRLWQQQNNFFPPVFSARKETPFSGIHMGKISADICAENCAILRILFSKIFLII
jgi:hypothetical protein